MCILSLTAYFFTHDVERLKQNDSIFSNDPINVVPERTRLASLDFIGSFIFVSGSILIVVGLTEGGESWKNASAYVPLVIGIVLFCAFFFWNCSSAQIVQGLKCLRVDTSEYFKRVQVLVPTEVLFMKNFIPIVLTFALNNACVFSCIYIINQYSQFVDGDSPLLAGVKLVPLIIIMVIGNGMCAVKSVKIRPRIGVALGFFFALAGSIILIQLHLIQNDVYWKLFVPSQILIGFGVAIFYPYGLQLALATAPNESKGIASGVTQTFGQLGIEITFSVMASILGNISRTRSGPTIKSRAGFQNCTYFTLAVASLGVLLTTLCLKEVDENIEDSISEDTQVTRIATEYKTEEEKDLRQV